MGFILGRKRGGSASRNSAAAKAAVTTTTTSNVAELLRIEQSGVPIYVQIRDQILRLIGRGVLAPGQQMWTMREVAVALRVDLNTVRHAYDALARTGAIDVIRAKGTYVAEKSPRPSEASLVDEVAQRSIAMAAHSGVDPVAVALKILKILKHPGDNK